MSCPLALIERPTYWLAVNPSAPIWAGMNDAGARLLQALSEGMDQENRAASLASEQSLDEELARKIVAGFAAETKLFWDCNGVAPYGGRAGQLDLQHLRELWLHVNDRCNFSCRHCLFSADGSGSDGLDTETLLSVIEQARGLGARTFYFTGGEPLLRDDLPRLLTEALADEDSHAVVLTNASLINEAFLTAVAGLDRERLHLQVSIDGSTPELNDDLRSPNAFRLTVAGLKAALAAGLDVTVATVVLAANLPDLPALATLLRDLGVISQHLMWPHVRERGAEQERPSAEQLSTDLMALKTHCDGIGLGLDNFENLRGVVEGEPGVKRDGTGAGWDSLAVYSDGGVYPSAALVGIPEVCGGSVLATDLATIWRESSVLAEYRNRAGIDVAAADGDPFLFLHGGGDPEHAYFFGRACDGESADPYLPIYRAMLLSCMDEATERRMTLLAERDGLPLVYHLMGQDGLGCPVKAGVTNTGPHRIDFAHSNCVLNADVVGHAREVVRDYYSEAAIEPKAEICCPVAVDRRYLSHIPQAVLDRSYGCGSPVFAANLSEGDTVVDLGSGGGIECFVASRIVGETGRVIGVDMTPDMLSVATEARDQVAANLGYSNVEFVRGYLEALPLADASVDVVLSNCVINLSPEKLKVFAEVRRVLKPGGRMVISDIVAGDAVPEQVKYNPRLKGECIAGAQTRQELLLMLSKLGFGDITIARENPWRVLEGVQFFSDTVIAERPNGTLPAPPYVLTTAAAEEDERHTDGCVVCGDPLVYLSPAREAECHYCGRVLHTQAVCAQGHYVCDQCHGGDYMRFVRSFVAQCDLTEPQSIFLAMKEAYPFPVHGPEHHALVPAAFLTAYRNLGGDISAEDLDEAIQQGADLPGGSCAYWGACAAALGMGVAYSTILKASPLSSSERCAAQDIVARILSRLATLDAARCCQRESLLALRIGAECAAELLPMAMPAPCCTPNCQQMWLNEECLGGGCPFAS